MILDRISKGSIGFGATVRAPPGSSSTDSNAHETVLEGEDELFEKYIPYYTPPPPPQPTTDNPQQSQNNTPGKRRLNTLDLVEPQDLQKYGLIPEFVGRLPVPQTVRAALRPVQHRAALHNRRPAYRRCHSREDGHGCQGFENGDGEVAGGCDV